MTVKKPVPCSIYDIPGMQEWLDEMALQGLFLVEFDRRCERATFRMGDPKPVCYRLDPVSKNRKRDLEREEPYAEMGWTFVDRIFRHFYVFSCDDPEAPELYTDPQSLAVALDDLMRREVRNNIILALVLFSILFFSVLISPHEYFRELLLWERPRYLVSYVVYPVLVALCLPLIFLEVKRTLNIRGTLAQGLPLKAGRRRNRPRFITVYIPVCILVFVLPRLLLPDIAWQVYDLDNAETVRPWPTFYQTEAAGPHPLEEEPEVQGYIKSNHSPLVPIQESYSVDWEAFTSYDEERIPPRPYSLQMYVEYLQVGSLKIARQAFQIELDDIVQILETSEKSNGPHRITGLTGFTAREYPGLDRLETAQYSQYGQDGWAIVAQRGTDIVMVKYIGFARWEDCLPLFLEALD